MISYEKRRQMLKESGWQKTTYRGQPAYEYSGDIYLDTDIDEMQDDEFLFILDL